ncbi:hypothetical protein Tco_1483173 [Tanacetum coccineum]
MPAMLSSVGKIDCNRLNTGSITNSNSYLRDILGDILGKDMHYPLTFVKPIRVSFVIKRNPKAQYSALTLDIHIRRSDDKEYEFSYADLPRLSLNDVEDMSGKLSANSQPYQTYDVLRRNSPKDTIHNVWNIQRSCVSQPTQLKKNKLGTGNKRLKGRDCTNKDVEKSNEMVDKIGKTLKHREQLRRLEEYVRGRPKTVNPRTFCDAVTLHVDVVAMHPDGVTSKS